MKITFTLTKSQVSAFKTIAGSTRLDSRTASYIIKKLFGDFLQSALEKKARYDDPIPPEAKL